MYSRKDLKKVATKRARVGQTVRDLPEAAGSQGMTLLIGKYI